MSYIVYLEKKLDIAILKEEIADFFNIEIKSIDFLDNLESEKETFISVDYFELGFVTRLSLYIDDKYIKDKKEVDFAISLAHHLKINTLISYWTNDPFFWILIEPEGNIFKVTEAPRDDEKGIEINALSKEPLDIEIVKRESRY